VEATSREDVEATSREDVEAASPAVEEREESREWIRRVNMAMAAATREL